MELNQMEIATKAIETTQRSNNFEVGTIIFTLILSSIIIIGLISIIIAMRKDKTTLNHQKY